MGSLDGKVAIITGGGNGIGREESLLFAKEGAKVVVNDPGGDRHGKGEDDAADQVVAEIKKDGGEAVASKDPVGTFENAKKIIKTAVDAFGHLDILVNNAGILRDRTILNMTEDEWYKVIEVHLNGTFTCLQAAAQLMKDQGTGGRIINTSSSSGLLGNFGQANYGAAKMGIHALTRIGAVELAKHKITVNAIAPMALTRMTFDLDSAMGKASPEERGPQHIAPLVAYLASDAASAVNGQTFGVGAGEVFIYKMLTSRGISRRGSEEPWSIEQIGKSMEHIINW